MDMDGMDMGGMDMGTDGPFRPTNQAIARGFWYALAAIIGLLTVLRALATVQSRYRRRLHLHNPHQIPSRPQGYIAQAFATTTAVFREASYPQPVYFTGRISKYFTPLPLGRWLILITYWMLLLCALWSDTILSPSDPMYGYKWEKVAFRAAWISVMQIPFVYLLSCKFNAVSILTGISYERLNWLHRWAARTVFMTVIVHWSFFFREWSLADFVTLELQMMPMVKYGFGAWSVIGWMILSGFGLFRSQYYELFVAQHVCAAATLLWLLYVHVPSYARYNIYMAIGFVAFDWSMRIVLGVLRNTSTLRPRLSKALGYAVQLTELPGDVVRLTIRDIDFNWRAGQHMYIAIPRLRPLELHPFTIANARSSDGRGTGEQLTMVVKAHSGFSKSLLRKARLQSAREPLQFRAFLLGPFGQPPDLRHYETVVLIACAEGSTFIVPLMQSLVEHNCATRIVLHWIIRSEDRYAWFADDLARVIQRAAEVGRAKLEVLVHVTQSSHGKWSLVETTSNKGFVRNMVYEKTRLEDESSLASLCSSENSDLVLSAYRTTEHQRSHISMRYDGRPSVESMIRPNVEAALGETAVVVCGGISITAQVRTFVAALSDERGVHKGSGAQGIYLFSETYGW